MQQTLLCKENNCEKYFMILACLEGIWTLFIRLIFGVISFSLGVLNKKSYFA
jgi:hypothetical protein